jgi:hypothetical protein
MELAAKQREQIPADYNRIDAECNPVFFGKIRWTRKSRLGT